MIFYHGEMYVTTLDEKLLYSVASVEYCLRPSNPQRSPPHVGWTNGLNALIQRGFDRELRCRRGIKFESQDLFDSNGKLSVWIEESRKSIILFFNSLTCEV